MKNIILLFLILVPAFLFAQYPTTGNKSRLGYQTTGDGLIWRGVAADTAIKPRTTANAYFQLDTVNRVLRRYIATQGSWQVVGGSSASIDSLIYATRYWVGSNFFPLEGGTLTGTGGAGFIGLPSQGTAPGTPASGLNIFAQGSSFNWKGTDGFERQITSSLTGGRNYALPDINGTFALGTGTTDRSARWAGTNTLGTGSWSDNLTRLQAQVPVQFQSVTTAGLPTGVTGYTVYNTTTNGLAWYQGSRWAYGLESTFNRGTATRVPFFDANGQVTDNAQLVFNSSTGVTTMASGSDILSFDNSNSSGFPEIRFFNGGVAEVFLIPGSWSSGGRQGLIVSANASGSSLTRLNALSLDASNIYGLQSLEILTLSGVTPYFRMFRAGAVDFRQEITSGSTMRWYDFDSSQDYFSFDKTNVRVGVLTAAPNYKFDINSTGAMGLPRGTVAQRPTIVSSTSPFRYNTDSTSLEYGESVGTWRQLATRAYARSLVSGLPTTNIYTANGTLTSNRTLTGGSYSLTFNAKTKIGLDSSFVHDPAQDTTFYKGNVRQNGNIYAQAGTNVGRTFPNVLYFKSDAAYSVAGTSYRNPGTGQFNWFILNDQRNFGEDGFGIKNENLQSAFGPPSYTTLFTIRNNGNVEIGYPYFSRYARVNSDTFMVSPSYTSSPEIVINTAPFYVVGHTYPRVVVQSKFYIGTDSTLKFDPTNDLLQLSAYGTLAKTAAATGKTGTNINATYATDGTLLEIERKRDTTVYIDDADYDWSAAITTAQIASRFNRVIFWMTTTAAAGSDSELTLHTPDANLMQVEYLIHSVDEPAGFDNKIVFGTNNAVDSTNGLVTNYFPAAGDGIHIRAGLRSGVYKYRYSN